MTDATWTGFIALLFGIGLAASLICAVERWLVRCAQRRRFRVVMELDRPRTSAVIRGRDCL